MKIYDVVDDDGSESDDDSDDYDNDDYDYDNVEYDELMSMIFILLLCYIYSFIRSLDYRKRNEDSMNHRCLGILAMFRHR